MFRRNLISLDNEEWFDYLQKRKRALLKDDLSFSPDTLRQIIDDKLSKVFKAISQLEEYYERDQAIDFLTTAFNKVPELCCNEQVAVKLYETINWLVDREEDGDVDAVTPEDCDRLRNLITIFEDKQRRLSPLVLTLNISQIPTYWISMAVNAILTGGVILSTRACNNDPEPSELPPPAPAVSHYDSPSLPSVEPEGHIVATKLEDFLQPVPSRGAQLIPRPSHSRINDAGENARDR